MRRSLSWSRTFLPAILAILLLGCGDNNAGSADDDAADDDNAADDDDQSGDFVKDGVHIIGRTTDDQGYVEYELEGSGRLGLYVRDEGDETALAGVKVYLAAKDVRAVVLTLDANGDYLPVLADVATLTPLASAAAADEDSVFDQDWLIGLPRSLNASVDEPLVISTQVSGDLLRVMLEFFFDAAGSQPLTGLSAAVSALLTDTHPAKVVQFGLLADPDATDGPVAVTLAVFDRSFEGVAEFLPALFASRCYAGSSTFDLYVSNDPLANSSPASYFYVLAAPNGSPEGAGTAALQVEARDAATAAPVADARLTLSPVGMVAFTDAAGAAEFDGLPICAGGAASTFYLRAARFGYYAAQFAVADLTAGETRQLAIRLSPTALGDDDPSWVSIPAGSFAMGCSPGDDWCDADEIPTHNVSLSAFKITEAPITQAQYQKVVAANPSWYYDCPSCPVEMVTFAEAEAACQALGAALPTEAQYEYAARAGATTRYPCGDSASCLGGVAWYIENAGSRTHPVKQKLPNAFGLYDMLGNVWEFTRDYYAADYYAQSPALDPTGPATGQYRVMRSGSWHSTPDNARVSNRFTGDPVGRYANFGFRCVR
jgi:formylglycine-generating enzyme required for sulfatase activity